METLTSPILNSTTLVREIVSDIIASFNVKGKIEGTGSDLNALEDSIVEALATKDAERERRIEEATKKVRGIKDYMIERKRIVRSSFKTPIHESAWFRRSDYQDILKWLNEVFALLTEASLGVEKQ